MKKNILIFIFICLILFPIFASALEIQYPTIEFGGREYALSEKTGIPELIAYVYYFVLLIGGIISLVVLFWGGINYLVSRESPEMVRNAKKWIFSALIGLVVLISSYLILYTLNPELVILKSGQLKTPEEISAQPSPAPKEGLEIQYPIVKIFGKEYALTKEANLSELLGYVYYFLLMIGGISALGVLIFGGVRYLTSGGSPSTISEAKKYIFGALIGLVILLSSYLILYTLNPELVLLKPPPLEEPPSLETTKPAPIGPVSEKSLPEAIKYAFNWTIGIGGLLAFIFLIFGGIKYIVSAGSPTQITDAKNQILASLTGLLILISAYLILTTINPQLVTLKLPSLLTPLEIETPEIELAREAKPVTCQEFDLRGNLLTFLEPREQVSDNPTTFDEAFILSQVLNNFLPGFKNISKETAITTEECDCAPTRSVCFQGGCCSCPSMPPFCLGEPCPPELKEEKIPELHEEINIGVELTKNLEKNINALDSNRKNLERMLEEIKTCRSDNSKKLYTCGELKDMVAVTKEPEKLMRELIGKETCEELNFYCCE